MSGFKCNTLLFETGYSVSYIPLKLNLHQRYHGMFIIKIQEIISIRNTFSTEDWLTFIKNWERYCNSNIFSPVSLAPSNQCMSCFIYQHQSSHSIAGGGGDYRNHIEAETKWPPFSRRHFQMPFLERKYFSLKFVPKGSNNNFPALFLIMAWRRLGDRPLSEPMMV